MLIVSMSLVDDATGSKSELSQILVDEVLAHGACIRLRGRGGSMYPFVQTGDMLLIEPKGAAELKIGDLVLYRRHSGTPVVHRLIKRNGSTSLITRGDGLFYNDPPVPPEQVLGRVIAVERNGHIRRLDSPLNQVVSIVWARLSPMSQWFRPVLRPVWKLYLRLRSFPERLKGLFHLCIRIVQGIYVYRRAVRLLRTGIELKEADNKEGQQVTWHAFPPSVDKTIFVAKRGGLIIGYVEWARRSEQNYPFDGHWLYGLTVRTFYRGMGIGEKLTKMVIEKSLKEGAKGLSLLVVENNHRAIRLYRKLGFDRRVIPALEKLLEEEQRTLGDRRVCMFISFE